ncbi:MAG: phage major capsid protein [Deltaproteobacteria bacterium]|nr:MAG: phage major capsid protein [Deltaproteobacteria bacterium]
MEQRRNFQLGKVRSVEDRTVEAVISSEHPVRRFKGREVLVHTPEAIDLSRVPLPLIVAHDDRTLPVGVVEDVRLDGNQLRGVLRFSKSRDDIWQDVTDGILRNLSVGYTTQREEPSAKGEYRVTRWMPYECSLVAAGADPTAQIGRQLNTKKHSEKELRTMDINDIKKERKQAIDNMVILAKTENMTEDQQRSLQDLKDQIRRYDLQIEALEMADGEDRANSPGECRLEIHGGDNNRSVFGGEEYKRVYDRFLRYGRASLYADEIRALTIGNDASMGYIVPDEFERKMVQALQDNDIMRSLCKVISTASDRKIPIVTGNSTASWMSENGTYTPSDVTLDQKTLEAFKMGVLTLASEELAYDAGFNLADFLSENFGRVMGDLEEAAFINGDGSGKPTGIIVGAQVGVTAAGTSAVTTDELIDLVHSLKRPYRKRAVFLMSDDMLKLIRKLKDSDGRYLYEEALRADVPSTLLGRPVHISDNVPAPTAGNKAIAFGDFSYYWIADRQGRYFQELREKYADTGQIGYRANQRVDGKLILPEAVQVLQMAES